jgi:transposase
MLLHANAKLGLAGRVALVRTIEQGSSLKAAAAAFSVSLATAHRWWHRWLEGGCQVAALCDRSSRPHRSPRLLTAELQERICDCRRETGRGPRLVAGATGFAHSTVWKVLRRHGLSQRQPTVKEPANRYEWPCPGDLLHMDVSRKSRLRLRTRDRRRPLPARLRRAPLRRESSDRHRLPRTSARLPRRPRDHSEAADDRQRLHLRQQPLAPRAAHKPSHPPPQNGAIPATHQRQGRALPPNDGTRMGLPPRLPNTPPPQRRPATLARQLQPDKTPQLNRRPATHQPRSQRPWVGHLAREGAARRAQRARPRAREAPPPP